MTNEGKLTIATVAVVGTACLVLVPALVANYVITKNDTSELNRVCARDGGFEEFNTKSFDMSVDEKNSFIKMIGDVVNSQGEQGTGEVEYKVDTDLFEKLRNNIWDKTNAPKGDIIDAKMTDFEKKLTGLDDLIEALKGGEVVAVNFFARTIDMTNTFAPDDNLMVKEVGGVIINGEAGLCSFRLDYVDPANPNKIAKSYQVYQILTEDIVKEPANAYINYAQGKTNFKVIEQDPSKIIVKENGDVSIQAPRDGDLTL